MERERARRPGLDREWHGDAAASAPGRQTSTQGLAPTGDAPELSPHGSRGPELVSAEVARSHGLVQFEPDPGAASHAGDGDVHGVAARGIAGAGGALPHLEAIQRSFGEHDVSGVRAHAGERADAATGALGARAYTMGDDVVLGRGADLRTAAHEAAHVVQQRAGVQLSGGVGRDGDAYERHADEVADLVVQGRSATGLLSRHAGPAVQRRAIQFEHREGRNTVQSEAIVRDLAAGEDVGAMRAVLRAMRQVAQRRRESNGDDHIVCVGGGDDFDLTIAARTSDELQRVLADRVAQLEGAAERARSVGGAHSGTRPQDRSRDAFTTTFNQHFASILPSLREAGDRARPRPEAEVTSQPEAPQEQAAQPPARQAGAGVGGEAITDFATDELRVMFSPGQRAKLARYFGDHQIPDRLFNGDDLGGCNAQQRIVLSGHILTHGEYTPGSFTQRLHARMCGHFARLVNVYAGVSEDRGAGVGGGQFDHEGNVCLPGGTSTAREGEMHRLPEDQQEGNRRFQREGIPVDQFDSISPGDWLYLFTNTNTAGGDHSVVFSRFLGPAETIDEVRLRRAMVFGQNHPDRGGSEAEWWLGEQYVSVRGHQVHPITRVQHASADHRPPASTDDLVEHELGLGPQTNETEQQRPELGSGPAAAANRRTVLGIERRHGGRLDVGRLRDWLRAHNNELIDRLAARSTPGQVALFRDANSRDDLETLVRLDQRLTVRVHNADELGDAEQRESERRDPQHAANQAEMEQRLAEIDAELATVDADLQRARAVLDLDSRIRSLEREQRGLERRVEWLDDMIARSRNPDGRQRLHVRRAPPAARLAAVIAELASARSARDPAATAEQRDRVNDDLGGNINMRQRVARLEARHTRLLREVGEVEASAGYHLAQPTGREAFRGRSDDGEREQRATGRLSELEPQPPWAELVVAQPGSAEAGQRAQRNTPRR